MLSSKILRVQGSGKGSWQGTVQGCQGGDMAKIVYGVVNNLGWQQFWRVAKMCREGDKGGISDILLILSVTQCIV